MSDRPADRYALTVLGTPDLRSPDGRRVASVLAQPKRLALLTYLALAPAPVSRTTVVATFWPDGDEARGRNALSQALFHLRRALGDNVVESLEGDRLWVPPERLWCDAREVLEGRATVADLAADLLEGWSADDAPPVQAWLEAQREGLRKRVVERAAPAGDAPDLSPTRARRASALPRLPVFRLGWATLAVVVLSAVVLTVGRLAGRPSTTELAVLLPRVTVAPGATALDPQVILDEVLAHLPERDGLRIVPAPSASSVPAFRTQMATIGADAEAPAWILEVSVRVTSGEVAVVGLLYRSPGLDVPGRESFGVTHGPTPSALLEVPREIARGVAAMVEQVIDGG
jgi:hypothetical protein